MLGLGLELEVEKKVSRVVWFASEGGEDLGYAFVVERSIRSSSWRELSYKEWVKGDKLTMMPKTG